MNTEDLTPRQRSNARAYRKRRDRLKAEGLCLNCGRQPPRPNRTLCMQCAVGHSQVSRYNYRRKSLMHVCQRCKALLPDGYEFVTCPKCRELNRQYQAAKYAKIRKGGGTNDL